MDSLDIYVVDDNRDAADSLAELLAHMGHRARPFYDAGDLLEMAGRSKPDCVLLDVAMDGMDGLELTRLLRARFGDDVVLIAITGVPEGSAAVKSTFRLVDHYFSKPVDVYKLEAILVGR
ncbi:response regulator [Variovorax sp. OV329]|uniref:response regulator n=1 Tax=Variovorax sp. OV329 TaxID=1882825 RepID=UPI0008EA6A14|nr:response regulator [Variovorax sp. OV329]SFM58676.1 Response regulator receiver domain-containing protein [Variovorax sp. OV329]